jgi:hypothetical protein
VHDCVCVWHLAYASGTLTQNKLSLNEPILITPISSDELNFFAALASKRDGSQDAIDFCICNAVTPADKYECGLCVASRV